MSTDLVLDPSQVAAVQLMLREPIAIVTGGPGCGKTTCLRSALDRIDEGPAPRCVHCDGRGMTARLDGLGRLDNDGPCSACDGTGAAPRYLLAAPTGKAARRMFEATGRPASTVHRLLEFGPGGSGLGFRRNAARPIAAGAVFVDESSMLDTELAAALVDAIDPMRTRLVLIGDANQLPSVGPGRIFAELIESGIVPVARLTKLHRAAAQSWVCSQAPVVLAGKRPDLEPRDDFHWRRAEDRSECMVRAVDAAHAYDAQVLVPQNIGPAGADALNARLQELRNPHGAKAWTVNKVDMRIHDAVIQTRNDYVLGIMNGETGRIVACTGDELTVDFGDADAPRRVVYGREQANALRLAYALTIHKSQGSEWPWVVVLCHSTHARMLTRQLLYTAITRAKVGVVIVGDEKGLTYALKQTRDADRNTALALRMHAHVGRRGAA